MGKRSGWIGARTCLAVSLGAVLVLSSVSAAAGDSIKIGLSRHIRVGHPFAITLRGYASPGAIKEVALLSGRHRCRSTFDAEAGIRTVSSWANEVVHGHFRFVDKDPYAQSTHGAQYFCAYVTYVQTGSSTLATSARASLRFRIPS